MKLKMKMGEIGIKIKEWRTKQDRKRESLKYMKEIRQNFLIYILISPILMPYYLQSDLWLLFLGVEFLFVGLVVDFHLKIKKKEESMLYLGDKIISCPHCKRNFDLHISGTEMVENR